MDDALVNINQVKQEITDKAELFDISAHLTDAEFEDAIENLAVFLLFDTLYEARVIKDRKILKRIPTINDIPLQCRADECPYATVCPVIRNLNEAQKRDLIGKPCRDERVYGIDMFARLVAELKVEPDHTVDLMLITSMVRDWLLMRRYDRQISIDGMIEEEPAVVDQKTGHVYWKRSLHPLHKLHETLQKQIAAKLNQLMASRKDRAALAAAMGKSDDLMKLLFSGKIGNRFFQDENALPTKAEDVIEGEIIEDEEED